MSIDGFDRKTLTKINVFTRDKQLAEDRFK